MKRRPLGCGLLLLGRTLGSKGALGKTACRSLGQLSAGARFTNWSNPFNSVANYTGRPLLAVPRDYYASLKSLPAVVEPDLWQVMQHDKPVEYYLGVDCETCNARIGDIVEVNTRDGSISHGIVVEVPERGQLRVLSCGETFTCAVEDVTFLLRNALDGTKIPSAGEPVLRNYLSVLNRASLKYSESIAPYLDVVYAQIARPKSVRGLSFDDILKRTMDLAARPSSSRILSPWIAYGTYLSVTSDSAFFLTRLDNKHPHFLTIPETIYDDMTYLTKPQGFNEAISELSHRLAGTSEDDSKIPPEWLQRLTNLFVFYICFPDPRLARLVGKVTSCIYPERNSESWLTAPSTAFRILTSAGLIAEDTSLFDMVSQFIEAPRESQLAPLVRKTIHHQPEIPRIHWDLPVYAFKGFEEIAFSIEVEKRDLWIVHVHIADVTGGTMFNSQAIKCLSLLGKSLKISDGSLDLVPQNYREIMGFGSKDPKSVNCFTFSVHLRPWNPHQWEKCSTTLTRITDYELMDVEPTELGLGWKYKQVGENLLNASHLVDQKLIPDLSRTDSNALSALRDTLQMIYWSRVEQGAIRSVSSNSTSFATPTNSGPSAIEQMIAEGRITAGRVAAQELGHNRALFDELKMIGGLVDLTKEERGLYKELLENLDTAAYDSIDNGTKEVVQYQYMEHNLAKPRKSQASNIGLGVSPYIDIANPFNSMQDIISQWYLLKQLVSAQDDGSGMGFAVEPNKPHRVEKWAETLVHRVEPQASLVDAIALRIDRFEKLRSLEEELQYQSYQIFRCTVLCGGEYPQTTRVYCHELDTVVYMSLLPNTKVEIGDRVVCNEILELSPMDDLIVLGL
ncbi:hypothetical protein TRVA0_020S01398 [Trichomonascus vanleenenianus]|uniref:uncharacterized protein n=1 Tax=Trichomonascus vanleenenianus TaxID=2268995 RepID=UPI003ECA0850